MTSWTVESLKAFEQDIADIFNTGVIKAPIHLSGGNERELIAYFKHRYSPGDWVCTAWRSHYHCLLAGVPPEQVKSAILAGKSITLCFPEYHVISSAIVGGILPIAAGIALSIKRNTPDFDIRLHMNKKGTVVHCFVGDMTEKSGIFYETYQYAAGHDLPISYVIEDNGMSVGTPTKEVWGDPAKVYPWLERHFYELPWPHAGSGQWIKF